MKVYVLQTGEFEDCFIVGVYSSVESAMAKSSGPWAKADNCECWANDGDDMYYAEINEYEVDG